MNPVVIVLLLIALAVVGAYTYRQRKKDTQPSSKSVFESHPHAVLNLLAGSDETDED